MDKLTRDRVSTLATKAAHGRAISVDDQAWLTSNVFMGQDKDALKLYSETFESQKATAGMFKLETKQGEGNFGMYLHFEVPKGKSLNMGLNKLNAFMEVVDKVGIDAIRKNLADKREQEWTFESKPVE
jgi:hypothetical protein